jgi:epoxide hydrolase-like predicted phosphatase
LSVCAPVLTYDNTKTSSSTRIVHRIRECRESRDRLASVVAVPSVRSAAPLCHPCVVVVQAVAFDIGGVLERVAPSDRWLGKWQERLGLAAAEFQAALAGVDPGDVIKTGGLSEAQYRQRYAAVLGLSGAQVEEFIADMWDWYCGELDHELTRYAASLRPRFATAIVSNSADGARREEQTRYGFAGLFGTIIYSHEVGLAKPDQRIYALLCNQLGVPPDEVVFVDDLQENVDAAIEFGIHGVLHRSTTESIGVIDSLIAT